MFCEDTSLYKQIDVVTRYMSDINRTFAWANLHDNEKQMKIIYWF